MGLIEECAALDWLLLTKRPEEVKRCVPLRWLRGEWPAHVWIGTTVEDQRRAKERLPHLLRIPAAVRFVSAEPLLEAVDLRPWLPAVPDPNGTALGWVIVGGESGPGARPFDLAWARSLRDQCAAASVPYFFKQGGARPIVRGTKAEIEAQGLAASRAAEYQPDGWHVHFADKKGGDPAEWPADLRVRQWPEVRGEAL